MFVFSWHTLPSTSLGEVLHSCTLFCLAIVTKDKDLQGLFFCQQSENIVISKKTIFSCRMGYIIWVYELYRCIGRIYGLYHIFLGQQLINLTLVHSLKHKQ